MRRVAFAGLCVALAAGGCVRTFQRDTVQPNPLSQPLDTLHASERIVIVTSDMDLDVPNQALSNKHDESASEMHYHHWPLINAASWSMVSRDRLRFHVQVDHKWEDYTNLRKWSVVLEDDRGRRWTPESIERVHQHLLTEMWDREQRTQMCDNSGRRMGGDCFNAIGFYNDGWKRRESLGSQSVWRGNADFVFYQRDLFDKDIQWLKLTIHHGTESFEYTWKFQDDVASE